MAMVEDSLSRYIQAMTLSFSWGSPLLASSAGTAASVHGTEPASWWQQAWTWPEPMPWQQLLQAQAIYSAATGKALDTPSSKSISEKLAVPGLPAAGKLTTFCAMRCGIKYMGRRDKMAECLVQECGADPETARKLGPQGDGLKEMVTYAGVLLLGVALVVAGAYALVT